MEIRCSQPDANRQARPEQCRTSARRSAGSHDRREQDLHSERDQRLRRVLYENRVTPHHRNVEPIPTVTLSSIFYPTDYPDKKNPQVGLVKSQQAELATLATGFKKYLEYDPDAKLSVEAFADPRGSKPYNQDLSERRVERIKQYLVDQGLSSDKVETAAYGKERPMPQDQVAQLEGTNPQTPPRRDSATRETTGGPTIGVPTSSCSHPVRSRRSSSHTGPTIPA